MFQANIMLDTSIYYSWAVFCTTYINHDNKLERKFK